MYLLDTNVVSELRKVESGRADRHVARWQAGVGASDLFISVVTLQELEVGILRVARRDRKQAERLRVWLNDWVRPTFKHRIIAVDEVVALRAATLHVPDPRPDRDAYIAATALTRDLIVVTRNTADFQPMEVRLFNPWEFE